MTEKTLRILLLEDHEDDAELLMMLLERAGYKLTTQRCSRRTSFAQALETPEQWDVILADYDLPGFSGLAALKLMQEREIDLPFIIVSGVMGEEAAVEAMRAGAHDFFTKNNLSRLTAAIEREIREAADRCKRQAAEEELRRSELRFMTIFKSSPMPTILFSIQDGDIIDANERFAQLIGYPHHDILNGNICDFPLWVDEQGNTRMIENINTSQAVRDFEFYFCNAAGATRHVLVSTEMLEIADVPCLLAMLYDITERKQAEDRMTRLQKITAALSSAITPAGVADVITDQAADALEASASAIGLVSEDQTQIKILKVAGYEAPLPDHWLNIPINTDYAPLALAIRNSKSIWVEDTSDDIFQERFMTMKGQNTIYRAWVAIPLMLDGRTIGGMAMSFKQPQVFDQEKRDFIMLLVGQCAQAMDRARLYDVEKHARVAAEEANAQKTQFLAMISHELRTPLQSIKGFTSTLLAQDVTWTPAEERDFIGTIDQHADRLTDLVNQLLEASRAQAGKLRIEPSAQQFADILRITMRQVEHLIQAHMLVPQVPNNLPLIRADDRRLSQVLTNLIENAAKYSPENTEIVINANVHDHMLQVSVSDQGMGIDPAAHHTVFEPFLQLDKGGTRSGTGLGLAICRYLVEAHGGRIWVEVPDYETISATKRPNGKQKTSGTTITFTIPLATS